jgi:hemerythrin
MEIQWSEDLSTGIADIDEQHKELFRRVNTLLGACVRQRCREEIDRYLAFLMEYVAYHFAAEEREMTAYRYPGLPSHQEQHEKFKQEIDAIGRQMRVYGVNHELIQVTLWSSVEWLITHVKGTDREMAAYLKEQKT